MGFVVVLIVLVAVAAAGFLIKKVVISEMDKNKERIAAIKKVVSDNGFVNYESYGGDIDNKLSGSSALLLYVDNNMRKWLLMSADFPSYYLCRDFSDLDSYSFFDEDGIDITGAMLKGVIGIGKLGIAAAGLGFFSSGVLAGLLGLSATTALAENIPQIKTSGVAKSYGIVVKTNDSNEETPFHVFDIPSLLFLKSSGKLNEMTKVANQAIGTFPRYGTHGGPYRKDVAAIGEIFEAFDRIKRNT